MTVKKILNFIIALVPAVLAFALIMTEPFFGLDAMLCDTPMMSQKDRPRERKI